jgi:hypothetical protein
MRADVEALVHDGGGLHNEGEEAPTPEESECGASAGSQRRIALGELDLVDAGLASMALLADLAERQAAVNAAVAQVRAAASWQLGQEERRRAVLEHVPLVALKAIQTEDETILWPSEDDNALPTGSRFPSPSPPPSP